MSYTPPTGNSVNFNFTGEYSAPGGNAVHFTFNEAGTPVSFTADLRAGITNVKAKGWDSRARASRTVARLGDSRVGASRTVARLGDARSAVSRQLSSGWDTMVGILEIVVVEANFDTLLAASSAVSGVADSQAKASRDMLFAGDMFAGISNERIHRGDTGAGIARLLTLHRDTTGRVSFSRSGTCDTTVATSRLLERGYDTEASTTCFLLVEVPFNTSLSVHHDRVLRPDTWAKISNDVDPTYDARVKLRSSRTLSIDTHIEVQTLLAAAYDALVRNSVNMSSLYDSLVIIQIPALGMAPTQLVCQISFTELQAAVLSGGLLSIQMSTTMEKVAVRKYNPLAIRISKTPVQ